MALSVGSRPLPVEQTETVAELSHHMATDLPLTNFAQVLKATRILTASQWAIDQPGL
jgi:hypothetical protein